MEITKSLILCILETHKMGTLANIEEPDKMPQNVALNRVCAVCLDKDKLKGLKENLKLEILTYDPLICNMNRPGSLLPNQMEESISLQRVNALTKSVSGAGLSPIVVNVISDQ